MIPDDLFDALCAAAREATAVAWQAAHSRTTMAPDEVAHIYELTTTGVLNLGGLWAPILSSRGISLKVTGVFAHQTPKATYDHPVSGEESPELADLVIVHEHTTSGTAGVPLITRRAVLVQAKMAHRGTPGKVDAVQEYLYQHWPDFELKGLGATRRERFLPGARDIRANLGGSRYGLIEKTAHAGAKTRTYPFCCGFPWTFSDPLDAIRTAGGEDAGSFIANMLFDSRWARGRSCQPVPSPLALSASPNNHFDVTIQELLDLTAFKVAQSKTHAHMGGKRGVSVVCWTPSTSQVFSVSGSGLQAFADGDDGDRYDGPPVAEDSDGGPRILLLETVSER